MATTLQDLEAANARFSKSVKSHSELEQIRRWQELRARTQRRNILEIVSGKMSPTKQYDFSENEDNRFVVICPVDRDENGDRHVFVVFASGRFEYLIEASCPVSVISKNEITNGGEVHQKMNARRVRVWNHLNSIWRQVKITQR